MSKIIQIICSICLQEISLTWQDYEMKFTEFIEKHIHNNALSLYCVECGCKAKHFPIFLLPIISNDGATQLIPSHLASNREFWLDHLKEHFKSEFLEEEQRQEDNAITDQIFRDFQTI